MPSFISLSGTERITLVTVSLLHIKKRKLQWIAVREKENKSLAFQWHLETILWNRNPYAKNSPHQKSTANDISINFCTCTTHSRLSSKVCKKKVSYLLSLGNYFCINLSNFQFQKFFVNIRNLFWLIVKAWENSCLRLLKFFFLFLTFFTLTCCFQQKLSSFNFLPENDELHSYWKVESILIFSVNFDIFESAVWALIVDLNENSYLI